MTFEDGILYAGEAGLEIRLRWRPEPLAEERLPGRPQATWRPAVPRIRLLFPAASLPPDGDGPALAAFRREVPGEIAEVVEPFQTRQWALMLLLHEQPRLVGWARGNPVLAYCLANNWEFRETTERAAAVSSRWHGHRRQREILGWLGFPATEAVARLFRRLPPGVVSPSVLRMLRSALREDRRTIRRLAHVPTLGLGVLRLVVNATLKEVATPALLNDVAASADEQDKAPTADLLTRAAALVGRMGPDRCLSPVRSVAESRAVGQAVAAEYRGYLRRLRDEKAARAAAEARRRTEEEAERRRVATSPFPPPPVPGTAQIVPLDSMAALRIEGREQQNCVGDYAAIVLAGEIYCYRVLAPERATLSIAKNPDGSWRREELKARGNSPARRATHNAVKQWLAAGGAGGRQRHTFREALPGPGAGQ